MIRALQDQQPSTRDNHFTTNSIFSTNHNFFLVDAAYSEEVATLAVIKVAINNNTWKITKVQSNKMHAQHSSEAETLAILAAMEYANTTYASIYSDALEIVNSISQLDDTAAPWQATYAIRSCKALFQQKQYIRLQYVDRQHTSLAHLVAAISYSLGIYETWPTQYIYSLLYPSTYDVPTAL